ncbi:MAG: hypothetical protein V2A79_00505 [Planctomycetota bacterium]
MMKFFRKHNRKLLAVFMCLLLVTWLGGTALQALLERDGSGGVWATYAGGEIKSDEYYRAATQTEYLANLGLDWRMPGGQLQAAALDLPSWLLLHMEARRMGIHSARPVVDTVLNQRRITPPMLAAVAYRSRVKTDAIYDAVAAFVDVLRYTSMMVEGAAAVNEAEVRRTAENVLSQVQVKAVVLRAEMFEDADETFVESEVQEQFDKYKDQKRTGKGLNFGYVLPPRLKVEYFKIDPQRIEALLPVDQKLEKDALYYWKGNKQDPAFRLPPEEKAPSDSASQPTSGPSTQPADEEAKPSTQPSTTTAAAEEEQPAFFSTWAEAKEAAIQLIRRKHAAERAQKLAEWLLTQTAEPWYEAEIGTNGYKVAREVVKQPNYYAGILKDAPVSLLGVEGVTLAATAWISPENVLDVPGIGSAALPNPSGAPIQFAQVAFNVEGLARIPTGEEAAGVDRTAYLSLYQTCPYAMHDSEGNVYVFRPVAVDGERPPRHLDEVRDQVVADLRFARGYQKAQVAAQALYEKALEGGLEAAWQADAVLRETVERYNAATDDRLRQGGFHEAVSVNRRQFTGDTVKNLPQIGTVNEGFVETCFALREPDAAAPRLRVIPISESGTVALVEWVKDVPLDEQRFKGLQSVLAQQLGRQRAVEYLGSWLDPKQIKARNQFDYKAGAGPLPARRLPSPAPSDYGY